jgi:hypothetical protein
LFFPNPFTQGKAMGESKPKYIDSNNKKWFDKTIIHLVQQGWTIVEKREKNGFFHVKLVKED